MRLAMLAEAEKEVGQDHPSNEQGGEKDAEEELVEVLRFEWASVG